MFNLPLDIKQQTIKLSGKLINCDENNFRLVGWLMVFNATFNNISVTSWLSVLLVEETGVPGEYHKVQFDFMYLV
jgi:hypothetical protein